MAVAAVALMAMFALSACGSNNSKSQGPATSNTSSSSAPATWDTHSHQTAQTKAATILSTWARPRLSAEQWWNDLKPLLSPEAREVYNYTDPANIPTLRITGRGVESNNTNPHVVTITFATTAGKFGVDLSRTSIRGKWIGESIIFPGEPSRLQG